MRKKEGGGKAEGNMKNVRISATLGVFLTLIFHGYALPNTVKIGESLYTFLFYFYSIFLIVQTILIIRKKKRIIENLIIKFS